MRAHKFAVILVGATIFVGLFNSSTPAIAQGFAEVQKRVDTLLGLKNAAPSPNCWNTALYTKGLYPVVGYVSAVQARYVIEHACAVTSRNYLNTEPGDLIRVHSAEQEVHAQLTLQPGIYFERAGVGMRYRAVGAIESSLMWLRPGRSFDVYECKHNLFLDLKQPRLRPLLIAAEKAQEVFMDLTLSANTRWQREMSHALAAIFADESFVSRLAAQEDQYLYLLVDTLVGLRILKSQFYAHEPLLERLIAITKRFEASYSQEFRKDLSYLDRNGT